MKTRIHFYNFDTKNPEENAAWVALREQLTATHPHCMEAMESTRGWDFKMIRPLDGTEIELETTHLFDNQWNTGPTATSDKGLRVFDWHLIVNFDNRARRTGHYLDQTPEMREIRRNTLKCGYCGKQEPAAKGDVFCPHCIDSQYLTEKDLHLTRMIPIDESGPGRDFKPLSEAERAHLLPLFREAQIHGTTERGKARIIKDRANVLAKCDRVTRSATIERDGFLWLMDRGINTANCIYYTHSDKFCFGWRKPLSQIEADGFGGLVEQLQGFPFEFEIKQEGSR